MKKATIVVSLIQECDKVSDRNIEKEIMKELASWVHIIPWVEKWKRSPLNEQPHPENIRLR
jgi:hypothetical protein